MEAITCELSAEKFDKALHGGLDNKPVLPEAGDLAIYCKPKATIGGNGMAVITFTVQLPDGTKARAQATTTAALLETVLSVVKVWKETGQL